MRILSASRLGVNATLGWVVLFLVACTSSPARDPHTFVVGIENALTTLDPRMATDAYSAKICQLIYAGLFRVGEDLQLVPELLASYQRLSPVTYQFILKPDVHFHDGRPLTASDVAWTYNSIRTRAVVSPHFAVFAKIRAIEVQNEQSFTITLAEPFAPFLAALTLGILPEGTSEARIGAGPFRLVEYLPEEKVVLARFPDYVGGAPKPERVVFRVIREDNLRVLELVRGRLDLLQNAVPPALIPYVQQQSGLTLEGAPGINYTYLGFNLTDPHLKALKVRQAMAHALDRTAIISYKLHGLARPATGVLAPNHWAYVEPGIEYPYDPDLARRLLDEAGLPDPDGHGPQARFQLLYKTSTQRDRVGLARLLAHYWNQIGIAVTVTPYEWGTLFRDIQKGNFQLYSLTWVGVTEPDILYSIFHSAEVPPKGANRNRYANPAVDQLTAAGRITFDDALRREIYSETQKIVARDLPYLSLWYEDNIVVRQREVQGYTIYPNASFMGLMNVTRVQVSN